MPWIEADFSTVADSNGQIHKDQLLAAPMSGKLRRFKVFTTSGCLNRTHHTDITITRTDDPSDKITIARDIKDCTELAGELDPPFNVIGGKSYIISLDSQGLNPNEQIAGVAGVYYTFFLDSASRITRPSASTIAPASVVMVALNFIDMPGLIQGKSELFLFLSSGSPARGVTIGHAFNSAEWPVILETLALGVAGTASTPNGLSGVSLYFRYSTPLTSMARVLALSVCQNDIVGIDSAYLYHVGSWHPVPLWDGGKGTSEVMRQPR